MPINWLGFIILFITTESIKIIIGIFLTRFWTWLLSDENLNRLSTSLKPQILIIYLEFLLNNIPVNELPEKAKELDREQNSPR